MQATCRLHTCSVQSYGNVLSYETHFQSYDSSNCTTVACNHTSITGNDTTLLRGSIHTHMIAWPFVFYEKFATPSQNHWTPLCLWEICFLMWLPWVLTVGLKLLTHYFCPFSTPHSPFSAPYSWAFMNPKGIMFVFRGVNFFTLTL